MRGKYLYWNEGFKVDIDKMDDHHRDLLNLLNSLYDIASDHPLSYRDLVAALDGIYLYTENHHTYEETLMRKYLFPGYESHRREHEHLVTMLKQFIKNPNKGENLHAFISDLSAWFVKHTKIEDKKLAAFLRDKGVK